MSFVESATRRTAKDAKSASIPDASVPQLPFPEHGVGRAPDVVAEHRLQGDPLLLVPSSPGGAVGELAGHGGVDPQEGVDGEDREVAPEGLDGPASPPLARPPSRTASRSPHRPKGKGRRAAPSSPASGPGASPVRAG